MSKKETSGPPAEPPSIMYGAGSMPPEVKNIEKPQGQTAEPVSTGATLKAGRNFPIIGIGASAGGLEALEQFFRNMPPDKGIAFVIVQHLDPTAHSSMPEILARYTKMPVQVAAEGMKVEPDSIYLIPPNKNIEIQKGVLRLQEPVKPPGLRLPVDFFFRSLARDKGADAIAIILSGTGSDGTLGLQAIKAAQGAVFVQDPQSARYDGMPRSAIGTGLADFVLKPADMPQSLIRFIEHSVINGAKSGEITEEVKEPLQQIYAILKTHTGNDYSHYKQATISRRLERRMSVNGINDIAKYVRFLNENEAEAKALQKDLLISVTSFFRDPEAFEALKSSLKELIKNKTQDADLRVWVPGCATGEEAYSIAIIVSESMDELRKHLQVQMYGTDIDTDALQIARNGLYPANIAADVTPERLKRFFIEEDSAYRVGKEIREKIVFAPQNFTKDPPFSKMDLICCRNLLIYLESDAQKSLIPLLHYALKPDGILFLGPSETVGASADLFGTLNKKWKIYTRLDVVVPVERLKFPTAFAPPFRETAGAVRKPAEVRISELSEKIFLDNYAPSFAVIDEKYRLVYVRGKTGRYLEIASGQPSLNILDIAREGLRTELGSAIYRVNSDKKTVVREGIRVKNNGGFQTINLTVAPLTEPGIPPGYLIVVFQEEPSAEAVKAVPGKPSNTSQKRITILEDELRLSKENLRLVIEDLRASNEELKASNEELQSNNEELQSTNEELDTSREELQSLNEELTTVNAELQDKNELLSRANDDLKNYLSRTDIAIIFLDEELKIRSYTPATTEMFNIRESDTGRPLGEIKSKLTYGNFDGDARESLHTLNPKEREVQCEDGHWYTMRILPYRTMQNIVSGLVISFLDINKQKQSEEESRKLAQSLLQRANELKVANKELEDYGFTISNYLKVPLRHLDGFSRAILEDYGSNLDERGRDYLKRIGASSKLMSVYLDKLLELSSVTLADLNYDSVNLSEIAQSIAARFKSSNPKRRVDFVISPGVVVSGDVYLLQLVMENLLDNALKFTRNEPEARIDFGVTKRSGKDAYFIKDNGPGFDLAYAENLFTPFVRLHSVGDFPGTGTGLAIVKRVIQRHGGEVWAESEVGKGSAFYFTLGQREEKPEEKKG